MSELFIIYETTDSKNNQFRTCNMLHFINLIQSAKRY